MSSSSEGLTAADEKPNPEHGIPRQAVTARTATSDLNSALIVWICRGIELIYLSPRLICSLIA